jgi:glycosyltransferase involved in cell wall biosynthesis
VSDARPRLVFVSPIFLFPLDAGGKIRTTNILRELKGGRFRVTLLCPASATQRARFAADIGTLCDEFIPWRASARPKWLRVFDLLGKLPVNVAADRTRVALEAVSSVAERGACELMVFDFVHAAVLLPRQLACASICFTHNVEAEIFERHAGSANQALMRRLWAAQHAKMRRFEGAALRRFTSVIAVSERDANHFREAYGITQVRSIPTGVDLDFFGWEAPPAVNPDFPATVVFTGSMDSAANIGGVKFFMESVWPLVLARRAEARFIVVGRNPPASLQALALGSRNVEFTGSVEDVRPFVRRGHVFVIPLLVGGGTRIKAFEAMAMGCPVVSTSIGIEGLDVEPDLHYLRRDEPGPMADAIAGLLDDQAHRIALSRAAREVVEKCFGHAVAAQAFERICLEAVRSHRLSPPADA